MNKARIVGCGQVYLIEYKDEKMINAYTSVKKNSDSLMDELVIHFYRSMQNMTGTIYPSACKQKYFRVECSRFLVFQSFLVLDVQQG